MSHDGDKPPLLNEWRQGDLALAPLQIPIVSHEDGEPALVFSRADHGVMVLSQSCEIVRDHVDRPWVQVAGLVPAEPDEIERARSGHAPSRLYLPVVAERGLLVDLEVVATVDKELIASWERTPGCSCDDEERKLAAALARHRQRYAFPDNFNDLVKPIRRWIEKKRKADSSHGRMIRAISEIRVTVDSWDNVTDLVFLALLTQTIPEAERPEWEKAAKMLEEKGKHADFPEPEFRLVTYDEISAAEYVRSDRLDWDGLSDAK